MGRQAAYQIRLDDGREIGFGLVVRDDAGTYSVQFRDPDGAKYVIRTTGERSRPRAIACAEKIVRDYYRTPETAAREMTWDELLEELPRQLRADAARPATVSDYLDTLRQARCAAATPTAVSDLLAQKWCNDYLSGTFTRDKGKGGREYSRSPQTLHSRVRKLKAIWGKYLVKRLRVCTGNPWQSVDLPKLDKPPIRTLSSDRVGDFFAWLAARWMGWELPTLFFETKALSGCRLGDLCQVKTTELRANNRLVFASGNAKARKERAAVLPADVAAKLKAMAGPTYLWESYASEIPKYLELRGVPTHRVISEFDPMRLCWWAKDEVDDFNKAHPDQPKLRSHDFRKRAVTEAHRAGLDVDTAAAAVGMSAATARGYYLAMDQDKAAAAMAEKLANTLRPGNRIAPDSTNE